MTKVAVKQVAQVAVEFPFEAYAHVVSRLSAQEGGGYLITFPDLPGCMSDGATEAEAVANGRDAFVSWLAARADAGKAIPAPADRPKPVSTAAGR
jgi:antitoxin HicB